MARERAEPGRRVANGNVDWSGQADELRSRFLGGVGKLKAQAQRSARRVKDAAQDLRSSPGLQHAIAARERGNLEAAFWLLNEEFTRTPGDPDVALHYWDVALSLGRVDIASAAGVQLIESRAAAGEPELAAQHWLELIKEAPDVLVSPAAIATLLPALKQRLAEARDDGPDDPYTLGGFLRRAVRHAVDPRNTGLHPGVALRIFEQGRDLNPEAARRAAEAALESPNLHEAKRQRLTDWLAGGSRDDSPAAAEAAPAPAAAPAAAVRPAPAPVSAPVASGSGLSRDEIQQAAARLPQAKPLADAGDEAPADTPVEPPVAEATPCEDETSPQITPGSLLSIDDAGLSVSGIEGDWIAYTDIQAVAVAEIMGMEETPVTVVDLIRNWARRADERLDIVRFRVTELDLTSLVTRKHALGSDFAALMGDIMERTSAIPLPDPESALGTRLTCFENPDLYHRVALRVPAPLR